MDDRQHTKNDMLPVVNRIIETNRRHLPIVRFHVHLVLLAIDCFPLYPFLFYFVNDCLNFAWFFFIVAIYNLFPSSYTFLFYWRSFWDCTSRTIASNVSKV